MFAIIIVIEFKLEIIPTEIGICETFFVTVIIMNVY